MQGTDCFCIELVREGLCLAPGLKAHEIDMGTPAKMCKWPLGHLSRPGRPRFDLSTDQALQGVCIVRVITIDQVYIKMELTFQPTKRVHLKKQPDLLLRRQLEVSGVAKMGLVNANDQAVRFKLSEKLEPDLPSCGCGCTCGETTRPLSFLDSRQHSLNNKTTIHDPRSADSTAYSLLLLLRYSLNLVPLYSRLLRQPPAEQLCCFGDCFALLLLIVGHPANNACTVVPESFPLQTYRASSYRIFIAACQPWIHQTTAPSLWTGSLLELLASVPNRVKKRRNVQNVPRKKCCRHGRRGKQEEQV